MQHIDIQTSSKTGTDSKCDAAGMIWSDNERPVKKTTLHQNPVCLLFDRYVLLYGYVNNKYTPFNSTAVIIPQAGPFRRGKGGRGQQGKAEDPAKGKEGEGGSNSGSPFWETISNSLDIGSVN